MIGDLYDANNVVVGQAAVLVAAEATALPDLGLFDLSDPFSTSPWTSYVLDVGSITSFTFSVGGQVTGAQTVSGLTAAALQTAIEALTTVGAGNVKVTGTTTTGPFRIAFDESVLNQAVTYTPTGGSGSSLVGPVWTPVGATDQGWTFATNKSVQDINIEEQSTPVETAMNSQNVAFDGALSEDISSTLALAYNALLTKVAAATGVPGYDKLTLTDTVIKYAVAMVTQHFNGMPRIYYAPKCSQLTNTSTAFRRANAKRMYPVSFNTLCKPSEIEIINITAAAL